MSGRFLMQQLGAMALLWGAGCSLMSGAAIVGSAVCASCHPAEFDKQSRSNHAHALQPIAGSFLESALLKQGHSPDGQLEYTAAAGSILVRENGTTDISTLQWAFGAGAQGITPVGVFEDQYMEHQFSYYARVQGFAPTFGHPRKPNAPIAEMGVLQSGKTISRCFNCHATGVGQSAAGPDLSGILPGVQCERCHGPGSSHVQAAQQHSGVETVRHQIVNAGRMPAKAQIQICGECHRLPGLDTGDVPELEDPVTVRFAPIGLLASRCFRESKTLTCLTCHNPHENARPRTDVSYTSKCLQCHAGDQRRVKLCQRRTEQNCLPCHMPEAGLGTYLRFTDHRIRVGEELR